jgi:hypothetical protein
MKTKLFFATCLLFCMAMTQLPAQHGKNGNGSISTRFASVPFLYRIEVNGEVLDIIEGFMPYHTVDHYVDGVWTVYRGQAHGVVTSTMTGKTYQISSILKPIEGEWIWMEGDFPWTPEEEDGYYLLDPQGYAMDHLICEDGTVYIIRYIWSVTDLVEGGTGFTDYEIRVVGKK